MCFDDQLVGDRIFVVIIIVVVAVVVRVFVFNFLALLAFIHHRSPGALNLRRNVYFADFFAKLGWHKLAQGLVIFRGKIHCCTCAIGLKADAP